MKKTKKLAALVLAMVMAFSCLAMPAMAAGDDEGIMPLGPVGACRKCGEEVDMHISQVGPNPITVGPCNVVETQHIHDVIVYTERYHCGACGYDGVRRWQSERCRGGQ